MGTFFVQIDSYWNDKLNGKSLDEHKFVERSILLVPYAHLTIAKWK